MSGHLLDPEGAITQSICITVSKPLNHLQLQLCLFKFCLSTVRSHFIPDLISGLQVFNRMKVFTDLCCCLDPSNAQSVLQSIVPPSCFLKTTWTALRTKVRRLQMRSPWRGLPGHLSCPSKRLGRFGIHPFAAVAISIWALGSELFSSLRFSGGDHGGPCRGAHRRSPGASVGRPRGGAHAT